jgi:hypothetical protein
MKSIRLSVILTIVNVVLSLVLSKVFSGGLEVGQITGSFGNVTLLEAMALFLYGGGVDFTSSVKWSSIVRFLRIPTKPKEDDERSDVFTEGHTKPKRISERESEIEKSRSGERRAIVYIISGAILLVEIVALAMLSS